MSTHRLAGVRNLIEFLHVNGKDPANTVQLVVGDKIIPTNLDALLNYSNWRSGKVWQNFQANAQEAFYNFITHAHYELPAGHKFVSHVYVADPEELSIRITTTAIAASGKAYTNEMVKFYAPGEYMHMVGMMHGVRHSHPVPDRLMDHCVLKVVPHYNDVTLVFPTDEKLYARDGFGGWKLIDSVVGSIDDVTGRSDSRNLEARGEA